MAARMPLAGRTTLPAALSSVADEADSEAEEVAERSVVLDESEESVVEAVDSSVVDESVALLVLEDDEPVEEALREELELLGTALHQDVFCCWAAKRLGSWVGGLLVKCLIEREVNRCSLPSGQLS